MNYLYTGVTYKFPIPKGDVNTILKRAVAIVAVGLNDHAEVQMYLATENVPDLVIIKNNYYFEISTSGLNPEWTEEKLREVGLKIKAETNTKVGLQTHGPYEISVNGKVLRDPVTDTYKGSLSQEEVIKYLEALNRESLQ